MNHFIRVGNAYDMSTRHENFTRLWECGRGTGPEKRVGGNHVERPKKLPSKMCLTLNVGRRERSSEWGSARVSGTSARGSASSVRLNEANPLDRVPLCSVYLCCQCQLSGQQVMHSGNTCTRKPNWDNNKANSRANVGEVQKVAKLESDLAAISLRPLSLFLFLFHSRDEPMRGNCDCD